MRMRSIGVIGLLCCGIAISLEVENEPVALRAVKHGTATLPCGQGKVFLDGPSSYLLWMKDNHILYRYPDERSYSIQTLEHAFGPQCYGEPCVDLTSLQLKQVEEHDGGRYRCRVHYQASPAVDYAIDLRIVDSPGMPKIMDLDGVDLSGSVGHLTLGSNLTLICKIDDNPETLVWWMRNGEEVARVETVQAGVLVTTVQILNATRNELDAHYLCLAQNADVTEPQSTSFVVKMHLPPLSVEIRLNDNLNFEAGQPRVVDCIVVGCVPPPTITWHLGDEMLRPSVHKELHDGNFTVSSLTLVPSLRDDKHELKCRAINPLLPGEIYETGVFLNVGFRPACKNDHEEVIEYVAGQVKSVNCTVEAYPEPIQFSWTFSNTKTLYTSVQKVPGRQHLYFSSLIWTPKDQDQGELLCRATNLLGEQKRACVYSIVAEQPPLNPDCEMLNNDSNTKRISCKKSHEKKQKNTITSTIIETTLITMLVGLIMCLITKCIINLKKSIMVSTTASVAMGSDGSFHRQPEFQPGPQEDPPCSKDPPCSQVILQMPNSAKYYMVPPNKAARLLGHSFTPSATLTAEEFSELENERKAYFV